MTPGYWYVRIATMKRYYSNGKKIVCVKKLQNKVYFNRFVNKNKIFLFLPPLGRISRGYLKLSLHTASTEC